MLQPTKQPDLCNRPRLEQYEVTPLASLPLANLGHWTMLKSLKPGCLPQVPQQKAISDRLGGLQMGLHEASMLTQIQKGPAQNIFKE